MKTAFSFASKQSLRNQIRAIRHTLTANQQIVAATRIISPAIELIDKYHIQKVACYLPFDGEISPIPLINQLWQKQIEVYLPVLHPFSAGHLLFLAYRPDTCLVNNRFGIKQPKLSLQDVLPLTELEMLFMPLVAYDKKGNRLGMGGGFYDRTLAEHPTLIKVGLAHHCQQIEELPYEEWDIPLDYILIGDLNNATNNKIRISR